MCSHNNLPKKWMSLRKKVTACKEKSKESIQFLTVVEGNEERCQNFNIFRGTKKKR